MLQETCDAGKAYNEQVGALRTECDLKALAAWTEKVGPSVGGASEGLSWPAKLPPGTSAEEMLKLASATLLKQPPEFHLRNYEKGN